MGIVGLFHTPLASWEGEQEKRGCSTDICVSSGYAFIADIHGLSIYDVTIPEHPRYIGRVDTPGEASSVAVAIPYAYIADRVHGLHTVTIAPSILRKLSTPWRQLVGLNTFLGRAIIFSWQIESWVCRSFR